MKRVTTYELRIGGEITVALEKGKSAFVNEGSGSEHHDSTDGHCPICVKLSSWHQAWDVAYEHLTSETNPRETIIVDDEHREAIASFTFIDQPLPSAAAGGAEADTGSGKLLDNRGWQSERIGASAAREFFLSRNTANFHWRMLEGAKHEVPFRLSYLERLQERHPHGPLAYLLEFVFDLRDRLMPRPSH